MKEDLGIPAAGKTKCMYKLILVPFIIAAITFLGVSCRSSKKIQTAINTSRKDSTNLNTNHAHDDSVAFIRETYNQLLKQNIDYTTFSAKLNVNYVGGDDRSYNVNAILRMYKDSAIWISINAIFGIEAMRAYITKDSVKLLDKQNKIYTARSVAYLQEVTDLPLDLSALQHLIIGNPVFLDSNIVSYSQSSNTISLLSIGEKFKNLITLNSSDKNLLHCKLDDLEMGRSRTCDLNYTDYDNKKGVNFSTGRKITVAEKSKLDVWLEFKQYSFNETLSFPFSVPKNYKSN
jgi:hypothetical protein